MSNAAAGDPAGVEPLFVPVRLRPPRWRAIAAAKLADAISAELGVEP
jgi:hypothetical protein